MWTYAHIHTGADTDTHTETDTDRDPDRVIVRSGIHIMDTPPPLSCPLAVSSEEEMGALTGEDALLPSSTPTRNVPPHKDALSLSRDPPLLSATSACPFFQAQQEDKQR